MTERAQKLKKTKNQTLIGLLIGLIGIGLFVIAFAIGGGTVADVLSVAAAAGTVVGFIMFGIGISNTAMAKRSYCAKCGEKFDYENDISWEEIGDRTETSANHGKVISIVEINCSCSNCDNNVTLRRNFTVATIDSKGNIRRNNLNVLLRKYFY